MKVDITEADIKEGRSRNPRWCPVGLAITRARGGRGQVSVYQTEVICYGPGKTSYFTPSVVRDFLLDFDNGNPVAPLSFDLPLEGDSK